MTKEEALQKANDYCNEKSYTTETLTDEFKDKFADFFAKKYTDTDADDEALTADLKFNLDTAFSATSRGITAKQKTHDAEILAFKNQIAELNKKLGKQDTPPPTVEIPDEIKQQLAELKQFKNEESRKEKYARIIKLAKANIRQDLHRSFETFAKDVNVELDKDDDEQAKAMCARFQEIFRDSIGDIKPLAPRQVQKREDELIASIGKIKVV